MGYQHDFVQKKNKKTLIRLSWPSAVSVHLGLKPATHVTWPADISPLRVKQTRSFCSFSYVSMVSALSHPKQRRRSASEVQAGQTKVARKEKKKEKRSNNTETRYDFNAQWMKVHSAVRCWAGVSFVKASLLFFGWPSGERQLHFVVGGGEK